MDQKTRLDIYKAQTDNVREIKKVRIQINRAINCAIIRNDMSLLEALTKNNTFIYCAWVEANFFKLVYTPYGFSLEEIKQIIRIYDDNGLGQGWKKCIELGTRKLLNNKKGNYVPNVRKKINTIIDENIVEPRLIRNKIAHGQWKIALNRNNSSVNQEITSQINSLDNITIYKWFEVNKYLTQLVEDLIESPRKEFNRNYLSRIIKLENFLEITKSWTTESKKVKLNNKKLKNISESTFFP